MYLNSLKLLCSAMLILDPAEVLAQQQKAAANRSPAAANQATSSAQNAALVSKGASQHVTQMSGHGSNMMYKPVANLASMQPAHMAPPGPGKPSLLNNRAQFMTNIQQMLAFADIRWKETNQIEKRKTARKLVQDVKQACGVTAVSAIQLVSKIELVTPLHVLSKLPQGPAGHHGLYSSCRILPRLSSSNRGSCAWSGMNLSLSFT